MGRRQRFQASKLAAIAVLTTLAVGNAMLPANTQVPGPMTVFRVPTEVSSPANPTVTVVGQGVHFINTRETAGARASAFFQIDQGVSGAFVSEIETALLKLPARAIKALAQHGYKIRISRTVPDAVPSARNQQVRGYEASATWNSVFGMFNRSTKRVVMAENAEIPDGAGGTRLSKLTDKQRRQGIVRHEFGHAVDQYLGNISHSPEFKTAYDQGVADISNAEKQVLNYYLQSGLAGKEETFAELFACLNEDACDRNSDILLRNHFSALTKLIRQRVASI